MSARLSDLHAALGGVLHGTGDRVVVRIAPLAEAGADAVAFVAHPRYRAALAGSRAGVVIAPPDLVADVLARSEPPAGGWACWESPDPYGTFARLTQWWRQHVQPRPAPVGVHPTAWVAPGARVHPTARLGPFAVVEDGAAVVVGQFIAENGIRQGGQGKRQQKCHGIHAPLPDDRGKH